MIEQDDSDKPRDAWSDERLRTKAREVIDRVNAGEIVLLDPELLAAMYRKYHAAGEKK